MYFFEWVYNHIIRAIASSALGIFSIYQPQKELAKNEAELIELLRQENQLYLRTIERLFTLTHQYCEVKIKKLDQKPVSPRKARILESLREIEADCLDILDKFKNTEL